MKATLRNYFFGLVAALAPIAHTAWATDYCHSFGDAGELARHVQIVALSYKTPEDSDFVSIFNAGVCARVYTINEGTPATLGVQLLSDGNDLAPGYPRGTIFRVKLKWDTSDFVFGAVQYRAANGRAYRVDEDGLNTLSMEVESIHMRLSMTTLEQCTTENEIDYDSYVDSYVYVSPRNSSQTGALFAGSDKLVSSIRAQNFITPSIDAQGALNFFMDSCDQGEEEPDLFASGFIPAESLDAVGIFSAQLGALSDAQFQSAFTVRSGSTDVTQLAGAFTKSYGEEISADGAPISESLQGVHFEVTGYKSEPEAAVTSPARFRAQLSSGQTTVGLLPKAKKALKSCFKKNGKKKRGMKLTFKRGNLGCRINRSKSR